MADLSKHRGTASALLAAGVVALGVIGGATAIVGARGASTPAATPGSSLQKGEAPKPQSAAPAATHVKVHGLRKWRPAKLPKRLALKPVIHHARKVVTVVTPVAVAVAAPATGAPRTRHASSKARAAKKTAAKKKHVTQPKTAAKKHSTSPPPAAKPSTDPGSGSGSPPAAPQPSSPPPAVVPPAPAAPPAPPAAPPPPAVPTATVAITGGKIAGRTVTAAWTGADPAATTYQWLLCDQDGKACQPIPGETMPTYTLKTTDIGKTIRVSVVSGTYSSTSKATDQIEQGG